MAVDDGFGRDETSSAHERLGDGLKRSVEKISFFLRPGKQAKEKTPSQCQQGNFAHKLDDADKQKQEVTPK